MFVDYLFKHCSEFLGGQRGPRMADGPAQSLSEKRKHGRDTEIDRENTIEPPGCPCET